LVRFRAEPDLFWEASECCLVHADLQTASNKSFTNEDIGIYMNPYVRVAYSSWTLKLLRITRRIERLYTVPHSLINFLARMPRFNPRRTELAGQEVKGKVWVTDAKLEKGGSFQEINRPAANGGYCGFRTLQLIKEKQPQKGERNWETSILNQFQITTPTPALNSRTCIMSASRPVAIDDAENIKRFMAMIPRASSATHSQGNPPTKPLNSLDINIDRSDMPAASDTAGGAAPPKRLPEHPIPEKQSDWTHENGCLDHRKQTDPSPEALQMQSSPQRSGTLAPPPTPETVPNSAIGKIMYDELSKIPEERTISLGESRYASKNYSPSTIRTSRSMYTSTFRSRPWDEGFSRMSFQAADSTAAPLRNDFGNATTESLTVREAPLAAPPKENGNPVEPPRLRSGQAQEMVAAKAEEDSDIAKFPPQQDQGTTQSNVFAEDRLDSSAKDISYSTNVDPFKAASPAAKPVLDLKLAESLDNPISNAEPNSGGALTPSSMTFAAVSPGKVAAAGIQSENLEGALYFKAWPKAEDRGRPAAKVRKVILGGLPPNASPTLVAALVYGGPLEQIVVRPPSRAEVVFLHAEDCMKYYDSTANGLLYKPPRGVNKDNYYPIMTELGKDVNVVSGVLREWIEKEVTRCVRAVGVDKDWSMAWIQETAARKGRKVEKIIDGENVNKMRSIIFRFCEIGDAVKFKQSLNRSEDWEECNIHYYPDP
ncbi:MAG: hypothetical protein Q9214_006210, partial [Letrouitia sp. 1 TL-2023]